MNIVWATVLLAVALPGCTRIKDTKGYVADPTLVAAVQPGVDNQQSILKTLGRPTFTSALDGSRWYYVSQKTRQLAFLWPNPYEHKILVVNFDAKGTVSRVDTMGRDQIVDVSPAGGSTPTRGRTFGFWEALIGNIGRLGSPNPGDKKGGEGDGG